MYKVFIVDDEELVIKSLIKSVDWEKYGFKVAGYSSSGYEAFDQIKILNPDIVFTDIRMPGMSGLELIKNLKESSSEAIFIVISGYAEFAYAQKAINYGALGYCLKPFDETEISTYLKKATVLLEGVKAVDEMELIEIIEEDSEASRAKLLEILEKNSVILTQQKGIYIILSIGKTKLNLSGVKGELCFKSGYDKYVYFVVDNGLEVLEKKLKEIKQEDIKGIGLSNKVIGFDQIKEEIKRAEMRAYQYFTTLTKDIVFLNDGENSLVNDFIHRLDDAIGTNDIPNINRLLDESLIYFLNQQLNIKQALIIYNHLISFLARKGVEFYEEYIYGYANLTKQFKNVQEMLKKLKELLGDRVHEEYGLTVLSTSNKTFKELLKYVDENFCKDITVNSISKEFYINASYVGQLFKKEAGVTFAEYLTQARINYAYTLITKTDLALNVIAEKVGYKDYFYFSRIFKRFNGQAPSYYRSNYNAMDKL